MTRRMSVAEAQERLLRIVRAIAAGGEAVEIEDRGRVVATIVGTTANEATRDESKVPKGRLSLLGLRALYGNPSDGDVDVFLDEIYDERARDVGRTVELPD